jgi:hypothetical protein
MVWLRIDAFAARVAQALRRETRIRKTSVPATTAAGTDCIDFDYSLVIAQTTADFGVV